MQIGDTVKKVSGAAQTKTAPARRRKRLSHEERADDARAEIFDAAAKVIDIYGYAGASISRITETAGIAQGTFYLYFQSRQDLFDELLPYAGMKMLDFIREHVRGSKDVYEMEERGFRAFFDYMDANKGLIRIINEAETSAPKAHRTHFKVLTDRYVKALDRWHREGMIQNFDREELVTIAYIMMSARSYLYMRYTKMSGKRKRVPEKVIQTYMRLVRSGLN